MNRNKLLQSQKESSVAAGKRDSLYPIASSESVVNMFKRPQFMKGVTLIEAVGAMSIMAIAAIGALTYQYHAARHARIAREQIVATRTAQLLLEDWKSTRDSSNYNPPDLGIGFSAPSAIPEEFTFDEVPGAPINDGIYSITVDGLPMQVVLKWRDVGYDGIAEVSLRELTVIVIFEQLDEGNLTKRSALQDMPPLILTTYVRIDGADG